MIEEFKKYICSNCKGQCDKGIVVIEDKGLKELRCWDYEKRDEVEGYIRQESRTAKQIKPLMRFTQEY